MSSARYHLKDNPIPDGFQIFDKSLGVAGISYRKRVAQAFVTSQEIWLEMERDRGNPYDQNAIKIIGCSKGSFWTRRHFIGYIPRGSAERIVEGGWFDRIIVRLESTYISSDGFVEVSFQIIGPKGEKHKYFSTA